MENRLDEREKIELLKFFYDKTRKESNFLRERQYKIFTWSSNVFIALIGLLFITDTSNTFAFNLYNPWIKTIASLMLIGLMVFCVDWQQRNRKWIRENGEVINKIEELLHCFDKGYFDTVGEKTLFPDNWRFSATQRRKSFIRRLFYANYVSATIFLGVLTAIMVWFYNP